MTKSIRMGLVALCAVAISACGGDEGAKVSSKEEAAAVAMGIGQSAQNAAQQQGGRLRALAAQIGATSSTEITADCKNGGSVTLKLDLSSLGGLDTTGGSTDSFSGELAYDVTYDGCRDEAWDNPQTPEKEEDVLELSGDMTFKMDFDFEGLDGAATGGTGSTGSFKWVMKGDLEVKGTFADSLKMDLTQELEWDTSGSTATAKLVLNGFVETSSEKFTYENESFTYSAATAQL